MKLVAVMIALVALLHGHSWPGRDTSHLHRRIATPTPTPTCLYDVPRGVGTLQRGYVSCPDVEPDADGDDAQTTN